MPLVQNSKVTILFLNIRGVLSHRAELEAYISAQPSFSFVGITESFLDASVKFVGLSGYSIVARLDRRDGRE